MDTTTLNNTDPIDLRDISFNRAGNITDDDTLEQLVESVLEHGHRMTLYEAVATILYGDRERSVDVALDYTSGEGKVILDQVANRLKEAGWYKRKVQRWNTRRLRWVNPAMEG